MTISPTSSRIMRCRSKSARSGPRQLKDSFKYLPEGHSLQHGGIDHPRTKPIIQVVRGVGELVGHIGDLGLEVAAQRRVIIAGIRHVVFGLVLDHALADFPGQVQTWELGITLLQLCDDSKGLAIVIKSAGVLHQPGQRHFAGMAEWRVPQVMRKADDLDQILVGAQGACHRAADLGNLESVRQDGCENSRPRR